MAAATTAAPDDEQIVFSQLGRLATRVPVSSMPDLGKGSRFGPRRSKFWFKAQPFEVDLEVMKKSIQRPKLEHVDSVIQERIETYKLEGPQQIRTNLEAIREFFLTELAPLTLAVSGGALQGSKVIEQIADSEVDPATISKFKQMMVRASTIKMAQFAVRYFDLDPEFLSTVMNAPKEDGMENLTKLIHQLIEEQRRQGHNTPEGTK